MISGLRMDRLARNVAEHRSETALPREGRMMDNTKSDMRNRQIVAGPLAQAARLGAELTTG